MMMISAVIANVLQCDHIVKTSLNRLLRKNTRNNYWVMPVMSDLFTTS